LTVLNGGEREGRVSETGQSSWAPREHPNTATGETEPQAGWVSPPHTDGTAHPAPHRTASKALQLRPAYPGGGRLVSFAQEQPQ